MNDATRRQIEAPPEKLAGGHATPSPARAVNAIGGWRRNALAVVDQAIGGGANFIMIVVLGRISGAAELGVYALALGVIFVALAAQESLLTTPYTVFATRLRGRRSAYYRGGTLAAHWVLGSAIVAAMALLGCALALSPIDRPAPAALWLLLPATPAWLLRELARRYEYAELKVAQALSINLAAAVIQLSALALLAAMNQLSAATALGASAAANGASGLAWLVWRRRTLRFSLRRSRLAGLRNWRLGRWLFFGQSTTTIGGHVTPWIIAVFLGAAATGVFAACQSLMRLANPLMMALLNVLTPRAAAAFASGGQGELQRIVRKATTAVLVLMTPICVAIAIGGDPLVRLLFGAEYAGHGGVVLVLVVAQTFNYLALAPGRGLLVLERSCDCLIADLAFAGVSITATLALVQQFGVWGAAVGILAANAVLLALMTWRYAARLRELQTPARQCSDEQRQTDGPPIGGGFVAATEAAQTKAALKAG